MTKEENDKIKQLINSTNIENQKIGLQTLWGLTTNLEECVYFYRLNLKPVVFWYDEQKTSWSQKQYYIGDYIIVLGRIKKIYGNDMELRIDLIKHSCNTSLHFGTYKSTPPLEEYLKLALEYSTKGTNKII